MRRTPLLLVLLAVVACGAPLDPGDPIDGEALPSTSMTSEADEGAATTTSADPTTFEASPTAEPTALLSSARAGGVTTGAATGVSSPPVSKTLLATTAAPSVTESSLDPPRPSAPWDVDPLDLVFGTPLRNLRTEAAEACDNLPNVPGLDACLRVVVEPDGADNDRCVIDIDYGDDRRGDKIRRGGTVSVTVSDKTCEELDNPQPATTTTTASVAEPTATTGATGPTTSTDEG